MVVKMENKNASERWLIRHKSRDARLGTVGESRLVAGTALIAVVRLRGTTGINKHIANTLRLLGLGNINNCIVIEETPGIMGMIKKAKDYITWGGIDDATLKLLQEKRGSSSSTSKKMFFRLNPARGGLGKRGIKASFVNSGALGNRKDKMNDLLKRMV